MFLLPCNIVFKCCIKVIERVAFTFEIKDLCCLNYLKKCMVNFSLK